MLDETLSKFEIKTSPDQSKVNKNKSGKDLPKYEAKTLSNKAKNNKNKSEKGLPKLETQTSSNQVIINKDTSVEVLPNPKVQASSDCTISIKALKNMSRPEETLLDNQKRKNSEGPSSKTAKVQILKQASQL